jgi:hypothetical protein
VHCIGQNGHLPWSFGISGEWSGYTVVIGVFMNSFRKAAARWRMHKCCRFCAVGPGADVSGAGLVDMQRAGDWWVIPIHASLLRGYQRRGKHFRRAMADPHGSVTNGAEWWNCVVCQALHV